MWISKVSNNCAYCLSPVGPGTSVVYRDTLHEACPRSEVVGQFGGLNEILS